MQRLFLLVTMAGLLMVSACGTATTTPAAEATVEAGGSATAGPIAVSGAWARAASPLGDTHAATPANGHTDEMDAMSGTNSAAYMTIRNSSGTPDRLLRISGDVARAVELHTVVREGEVMRMEPVDAIDVPANGEAVLEPGGFHVMLIGITRDLAPGDTLTMTLEFERAGSLPLQLAVRR